MIWFTSDTHFGHKNIIRLSNRSKFKDIQDMDESIIATINKYVKPGDVLWHLGDFVMGRRSGGDSISGDQVGYYRKKIDCKTVNIVYGNHDDRPKTRPHFSSAYEFYELKNGYGDDKLSITLCHYAMIVWNKSHYGAYHLYGHSHSELEENMNKWFPERRSMDVGVDNTYKLFGEYRPISLDEIKEIFKNRKGEVVDKHGAK